MAATHPWIDTSESPLLRATYPVGATSDEVAAFLRVLEELVLEQHGPYGWVHDFGRSLDAVQRDIRRQFAISQRKIADHDRKYCAGVALYVPNPVVRGVITAVYWLSPPAYPYRFFSNLAEATVWARARLQKARAAA
jgi:hypothetical protein